MKVTLVGAGPGGVGLLTLRGLEVLQAADVVLYDRFVSDDILAVIPDSAEKIDVGKHAGRHPVPQDAINTLLLERAKEGKNVVRLKGGDPFVFARGGEELELLAENNIPFEVVPGVTSAVAAATYAGIPITHRDYASSFHVITAHAKNNEPIDIDFDALVKLDGTLVFLMGASVIDDICEKCLLAGMDKDIPAAVVENAAANNQRKFLGTVATLPQIAKANNVESPAVIIIGKVCRFATRYDWFDRKPLRGKRIVVVSIKYRTSKLSNALRELGCDVVEIPYLKIVPLIATNDTLTDKLKNIKDYSWLVFTSGVGVNIFFDYLKEALIDIRGLINVKIACVGMETEKEVNKRGIKVEYVPDEYNGAALGRGLSILVKNGERALIAGAKDGDRDLTDVLTETGVAFDDVPIYEKVRDDKTASAVINDFDFAAFTSPSAVKGFAEIFVSMDFGKIKAVCIGEKTASAARALGMEVYVSTEAAVGSMVEKIMELSA
ncbi:MAG: uroporphyrinogen-III C-methyltransferase [Chitinispirillales bacterium]|jgi:uroporphyrinogen III methyltransferase/synthase|nr:uroporphyrinogen-III C-methyltransferase [Chitinispirillales bacterium]